jgi:hypothetical protein
MTNLFQTILFATRSNDGVVIEHPSLNDALEAFMADDGYRLDFLFPDKRVLFIYRSEYNEDIPEEKLNHPAYKDYHQANAKVMLYDPHKTSDLNSITNVIPLFS